MNEMQLGDKIQITDNLFKNTVIGIITEIEICYFRITTNNGTKLTYHWDDDIEIKSL